MLQLHACGCAVAMAHRCLGRALPASRPSLNPTPKPGPAPSSCSAPTGVPPCYIPPWLLYPTCSSCCCTSSPQSSSSSWYVSACVEACVTSVMASWSMRALRSHVALMLTLSLPAGLCGVPCQVPCCLV